MKLPPHQAKAILSRWAEMDEHKKAVEKANNLVANVPGKCYVAFSGGKDSTVMLHLVLQEKPDVTVFHFDYGDYFMPRWVEREIAANMRALGAKNIITRKTRLQKPYFGLSEYFAVVTELFGDYDRAFVGLREEESVGRRLRIRGRKSIGPIREVWPIAHFTWKDVWAYVFSRGLPYCSVYDRYAPAVGWDQARFATFFDPEFDKFGASQLDGVLMWRDRNKT